MPDLQDYLWNLLGLKVSSSNIADVTRLEGLIGLQDLLSALLFDNIWLQPNLA